MNEEIGTSSMGNLKCVMCVNNDVFIFGTKK